nr:toprim domain-containing protein [Mycobacteroides chelonae]
MDASIRYFQSYPGSPGAGYMASRGLDEPEFKLGYVANPLAGHEMYRGTLAIPYVRWSPEFGWSVVSIRFRRLDNEKPKYMTVSGDRPRLYNTRALLKPVKSVCITEGEIDAITAESCGLPTVGVPGATSWKKHFREPFLGYREVFILADGDDAGMTFAETVANDLPNAKVIPMPRGSDVNDLVLREGKQALLERLK